MISSRTVLSSSLKYARYRGDETIGNLGVGPTSRVIVQGFTGKAGTFHSEIAMMRKKGDGNRNENETKNGNSVRPTNIVGGVSPRLSTNVGTHLGKPVYKTVEEAASYLKPDASVVYVPPLQAKDAIISAIESEIPLIVCVSEGIPIHDQLEIQQALQSQWKSRLVGANTAGMINTRGCKLGIQPILAHSVGSVGIISKSGTLSYEVANATSEMGLGQSFVIGVGGDPFPGTSSLEALKFLVNEPNTKGIIILGEIGSTFETEVAEWLSENQTILQQKPIVGYIAGIVAPPSRTMGHAGAMWEHGLGDDAPTKIKQWRRAGIKVVENTSQTAVVMNEELAKKKIEMK